MRNQVRPKMIPTVGTIDAKNTMPLFGVLIMTLLAPFGAFRECLSPSLTSLLSDPRAPSLAYSNIRSHLCEDVSEFNGLSMRLLKLADALIKSSGKKAQVLRQAGPANVSEKCGSWLVSLKHFLPLAEVLDELTYVCGRKKGLCGGL